MQKVCILFPYEILQRIGNKIITILYYRFFIYTLESHLTFEENLKLHMKNDIPKIPSHLHISEPNLLMNFITSSSNFITRFLWHFEVTFSPTASGGLFFEHTKNACFWICLQNLFSRFRRFIKMQRSLWKISCNLELF